MVMTKTTIAALAIAALVFTPGAAHADTMFEMCPDGREGIVGGHTTCDFADNVRRAYYDSGQSSHFDA
jgi:hypothetical protein